MACPRRPPAFAKALAETETIREDGVEKTRIIGVCENRVSPLLVNVLILICLPLIGQLEKIPTCVICDGLFLFMGLSGLPGNQLFERIKLVFTEETLYPTLAYTETEVPRRRMHVFTLLQFFFVAVLFGVARSPIALAFPVFLVASIPFRMLLPKLTCGFLTADMVACLDHAKNKDADQIEATKEEAPTVTVEEAKQVEAKGGDDKPQTVFQF